MLSTTVNYGHYMCFPSTYMLYSSEIGLDPSVAPLGTLSDQRSSRPVRCATRSYREPALHRRGGGNLPWNAQTTGSKSIEFLYNIYIYIYIIIHTYTHIYIYVDIYIYMCIYIYVYIYICIYIYMKVCMYVNNIYIYTYLRLHAYTHLKPPKWI